MKYRNLWEFDKNKAFDMNVKSARNIYLNLRIRPPWMIPKL